MARKETNFKQTDIGLIPNDWDIVSIGELGPMSKGFGISRAESLTGEIPAVRYGENYTNHNDYIRSFTSFISAETAKKARRIKSGDLLFTASGETKEDIGKCVAFIDDFEAYAGGDIIIVSTTIQDSTFLGYVLNSPIARKQKTNFGQGDTVVHISAHTLGLVQIPLPPLKEQKRIAEVLSHFDEHIDNLVALLEKRKQVKAATMQALLSGTTRLPGFTAPWQDIALGKLCLSMNSGGTPDSKNPNFYGGDIPFLSIADMTLQGKYVSKTSKTITKEGLDNSSARLVSRGVLLYAMYASLGKCSLSCIDLSISQAILAIETNPNLLSTNYLYYYLTYIEEAVKTLGQTGTQTNLSKQLVKEICVTAPTSVKEQEAIADILSNMDRGIEALEEQIEKYRQMKEGAMGELLTGKVRLI